MGTFGNIRDQHVARRQDLPIAAAVAGSSLTKGKPGAPSGDLDVLNRSISIVEAQVPELAKGPMQVPLDYFRDEGIAARERELFMPLPRPVVASGEFAGSDDYLVRTSMDRSLLTTRGIEGKAHVFLN
jgi:choline monooxygenase